MVVLPNATVELTINGEPEPDLAHQITQFFDRYAELTVPYRGPRHTPGIDVRRETLSGVPMSAPYLSVWCSCGWAGDRITVPDLKDPDDIPTEAIEEAARSWRFHVRLSNRLYRTDKRLRREAAAARAAQEEE